MRWCSSQGIPHSEFLEWDDEDRAKQTAWLLEDSARCSRCGTSQWEWDADRFAYSTAMHHCKGCMLLEAAAEDQTDPIPGSTMVLIPRKG